MIIFYLKLTSKEMGSRPRVFFQFSGVENYAKYTTIKKK
jgi:hypothetical protein